MRANRSSSSTGVSQYRRLIEASPTRGAEPGGTPDRSKLFGAHGQRPWLHDVVMDGVRAHAELAGDHAERSTASDGSDHGPTAGGLTVSLVMVHLSRGRRFPSSLPAERSGCSVTQVFGMLCHLPQSALPFA